MALTSPPQVARPVAEYGEAKGEMDFGMFQTLAEEPEHGPKIFEHLVEGLTFSMMLNAEKLVSGFVDYGKSVGVEGWDRLDKIVVTPDALTLFRAGHDDFQEVEDRKEEILELFPQILDKGLKNLRRIEIGCNDVSNRRFTDAQMVQLLASITDRKLKSLSELKVVALDLDEGSEVYEALLTLINNKYKHLNTLDLDHAKGMFGILGVSFKDTGIEVSLGDNYSGEQLPRILVKFLSLKGKSEHGDRLILKTREFFKMQKWMYRLLICEQFDLKEVQIHIAQADQLNVTFPFIVEGGVYIHPMQRVGRLVVSAWYEKGLRMLGAKFAFVSPSALTDLFPYVTHLHVTMSTQWSNIDKEMIKDEILDENRDTVTGYLRRNAVTSDNTAKKSWQVLQKIFKQLSAVVKRVCETGVFTTRLPNCTKSFELHVRNVDTRVQLMAEDMGRWMGNLGLDMSEIHVPGEMSRYVEMKLQGDMTFTVILAE